MNNSVELELNQKLDLVIHLLASIQVKDMSKSEAIRHLGQLGLNRIQISTVTGASPSTVSVRLSEAKKNTSKK